MPGSVTASSTPACSDSGGHGEAQASCRRSLRARRYMAADHRASSHYGIGESGRGWVLDLVRIEKRKSRQRRPQEQWRHTSDGAAKSRQTGRIHSQDCGSDRRYPPHDGPRRLSRLRQENVCSAGVSAGGNSSADHSHGRRKRRDRDRTAPQRARHIGGQGKSACGLEHAEGSRDAGHARRGIQLPSSG